MTDRVPTLTIPIESRSTIEAKALRIILERRLTILSADRRRVYAECRGSDKIYHPGRDQNRWWCDCDAKGRCSHLAALQHVTVRPE